MSERLRVRFADEHGILEVDLSAGQALDLAAGKAIAYWPAPEPVGVDEDGRLVERDDAARGAP